MKRGRRMPAVVVGLIMAAALAALNSTAGAVTLQECIDAARADSPDAQAASSRIQAAEAMQREVRSAYYPWVVLSGGYTATDNPPQAFMMTLNQQKLDMRAPDFDPNKPDDTDNFRFSAAVKYRLYDGGVRQLDKATAVLGKRAAEAQLQMVHNELIHQINQGYYGTLQAKAFVTVQKESVASLEESLRVASERYKEGAAFLTDVLNIEVKLAEAKENMIRARNSVNLAMASLNAAIGREFVASADMLPEPGGEEVNATPPVLECGQLKNRPELKAARNNTLMKEKAYDKARRRYYPVLNAFGSYDWDSDELSAFQDSYTVGAMTEWEVFTGFQRGGAVERTRAEWQQARHEEQALQKRLELDMRQACLGSIDAIERLDVAAKSVENAREALRITQERYQQGAADITELLMAQVGLTAAQTRRFAAHYDVLIAASNVERAKGALAEKWRE